MVDVSFSGTITMSSNQQFDHEKLDVYQLALSFVSWLTDLIAEVRESKSPQLREIIDQVDRASTSIVLNIAEGNGRRSTKQRARFFDDARGSATESAACLDVLIAKKAATRERVSEGKQTLLRVVAMLTKLVERFDK